MLKADRVVDTPVLRISMSIVFVHVFLCVFYLYLYVFCICIGILYNYICIYILETSPGCVLKVDGFVDICTYGSDSAGRGKRLFYVLFFLKVELPCDLT